MPGWSAPQVQSLARQFAQSSQGRAWWAFVPAVREALVAEVVLGVVLAQDREHVSVEAVERLRDDLRRVLAERHKMRVDDAARPEDA